jgi:hypothetical protein
LISLGESFAGRPPLRPRARAAFRPATVLSRIKFLSNSACAAKTWKTRATGRRVGLDLLGQRFEVDLALFKFGDQTDKIGQVPTQPIQSPDDERVAFTHALEAAFELWPARAFRA